MQLDGQTNSSIEMCVTKKSLAHQVPWFRKYLTSHSQSQNLAP